MSPCISDTTVESFLANRLDPEQLQELLAHLDECQACRDALLRRVVLLRSLDTEGHALPSAGGHAGASDGLCETGEWRTSDGEAEPDSRVGQQLADGGPLKPLVEKSLSQLGSLSFPTERCHRCFESGLSEIGRLKLERQLGQGGSSVVYLAYDPVLKRQVALKLPRGPVFANASARERFLREAQAAAVLRHPNIVPVYGAGEIAGTFHITLGYCSGPTLAQWLKQRRNGTQAVGGRAKTGQGTSGVAPPVAPAAVARIIEQLADAVDHAHKSGVLHRDIKPNNILLEPRQEINGDEFPFVPMLSDFGLAFLADEQSDLTATGAVLGTPQYMAPEQASGRNDQLGPATDVYGLGTVLYELLTGQPPIQGSNYAETVMRVTTEDPVWPRRIVPDIPRDLEAICLKCLQKSPHQRYRTAAELADDLRRLQAGEPTVARPVTHLSRALRWSRRHPAITALTLLSLIAVIALIIGQRVYNVRLDGLNTQLSESLEQTRRAQQSAEQSEQAAQQLLYASDIKLASEAWKAHDLRSYDSVLQRHRPGAQQRDIRGVEWHYLWQLGHQKHETLGAHDGDVYLVRYSPDGRWIISAGKDAIVRFYDARDQRLEIELSTGQREVNDVAFAPDGKRVATAGDDGTVRVWDLSSREELVRIEAHDGLAFQVVFTADGKLVSCGNEPDIRLWNADTGESLGVLRGHQDAVQAIVLAPDGWHLGSASSDHTARIWDLRQGEQAQLVYRHSSTASCVAFSADGGFAATGTKGGEVYLHDLDSQEHGALLQRLDSVHSVEFAPDGRTIAVADRGGTLGVWRTSEVVTSLPNGDFAEPVAAWQAHSGRAWSLAYSPDAQEIVTAGSDGNVRLWRTSRLPCWRTLDLHQRRDFKSSPRGNRWLFVADEPATLVTAAHPHGLLLWDLSNIRSHQLDAATALTPMEQNVAPAEPVVLDPGDWIVSNGSADARLVAAGSVQGDVAIWDLATRERRMTCSLDPPVSIGGVVFSPDAAVLAAHDSDNTWLVRTDLGRSVHHMEMEDCRAADFSPDGAQLALGDGNHVLLVDVARPQRPRALEGHSSSVRTVAYSPDGRLLASGGNDRMIIFWHAATGERVFQLQGHRSSIADIAFAHDGRSLVAADDAGTLRLWHVASGQELCILDEISTAYRGVSFLPEGQGLVCNYGRFNVRLLDWSVPD